MSGLAGAEAQTTEMTAAAERGDFEAVERVRAARDADLRAFFARPVAAEDAPSVGAAIERILAADREIVACADRAQVETRRALADCREGRRASHAYGRVTG